MKNIINYGLVSVAAVFGLAVIAPAVSVYAHEDEAEPKHAAQEDGQSTIKEVAPTIKDGHPTVKPRQTTIKEGQSTAQADGTERKAEVKTKLADNKLKVCQKREKKITNIMSRQSDRGTKQIAVFTKISDRTQAFYVEKGRTVANYDALVADVVAKKALAEAEIAKVTENTVAFKCDGTDPKGAGEVFKQSLKAQHAAIKEYKTAVKNLIVGVKSAKSNTVKPAEPTETTEGAE